MTLARPVVAATVDIGSNSIHLLVAVVREHRLEPLADESLFLGLGEAVNAGPSFGPDVSRRLVDAVARYVERARSLGATRIVVVGTEPLRRAEDSTAVVAELRRQHRIRVLVLDHEEEALLTLLGVTGGRRLTAPLVVADVGGGSSEIVVASPDRDPEARGVRLGSAALTASHVDHDPPTRAEVRAMLRASRDVLTGLPDATPREIIVVGGTASNLVRLIPESILDRRLTGPRIRRALDELVATPTATLAERHAIRPERARTMAAGAAILTGVLERYRAPWLMVSEAGIREGAVIAAAHAGVRWRPALPRLAAGWLAPGDGQSSSRT